MRLTKREIMLKTLLGAALLGAVVSSPDSGLKVGDAVSAFHPQHVAGPHKGTDACPP